MALATLLPCYWGPGILPQTFPGCIICLLEDILSYKLSWQAFGVFGLCQIHAFIDYLRSKLSRVQFDTLFWSLTVFVVSTAVIVGGALTFMGSECFHA